MNLMPELMAYMHATFEDKIHVHVHDIHLL